MSEPSTSHDETHRAKVGASLLLQLVLPVLGTAAAAAIWAAWGWAPGAVEWMLFASLFLVTQLGHSMGVHRLFSHQAFETGPVLRAVLAILAVMNGRITVAGYALVHRYHHRFSDRIEDHQSPRVGVSPDWSRSLSGIVRGIWHAHVKVHLESYGHQAMTEHVNLVTDLMRDQVIRRIDRHQGAIVWLGWVVPGVIAGLCAGSWTAALLGVLWGGACRMLLGWTAMDMITWLGHAERFGSAPYACKDQSRNNWLVAILALGDGWHNNHHAFPASARHGLRWWQIDVTWLVIVALEKLGLLWNVRRLPRHIAERRLRSAAQQS